MTSRKRILIAEDEQHVAFFLGQSLERCSDAYEVLIARSGEEALEKARIQPVDLLISDLALGGITGFDVVRRLRSANPRLPVIVITAYGSRSVYDEAERLRVQVMLDKPFQIGQFVRTVRSVLRSHSSETFAT